MEIQIDKIDKKILHFLLENCRYPNSYIAKCLKISEQLVKYRIDRLEKSGVIATYGTNTMMNAIGIFRYMNVFLKIKKTRENEIKDIVRYLKSSSIIPIVFVCEGIWNLGFNISSALINDVKPIVDNVQRLSKGYLEDLKILNISHFRNLNKQFFGENIDDLHIKIKSKKTGTYFGKELIEGKNAWFFGVADFDNLDLKILKNIKKNARIPLSSLAEKCGCNILTAKNRIANMIRKGIINGFTIQIDYEKLGFNKTIVLFSVLTEEKYQEEIRKYVEENFNAVYSVQEYLDYWNMAFVVYAKDKEYIDNMIENILNHYRDRISDFTKLNVLKLEKNKIYEIDIDKIYTDAISLLESRRISQ